MLGRLFESPVHLLILVLVIVLIFGSRRLPDAARGLGRSLRIFKAEVKEMREDGKPSTTPGQPTTASGDALEGRIVDERAERAERARSEQSRDL
jgi:sec-independent protein translocase protein TatA